MKKRYLLIAALAVAGLLVFLCIGGLILVRSAWTGGPGTDETEAFLQALKDEDYEAAYALCSDDFKASTSLDEFVRSIERDALQPRSWAGPISKTNPDGRRRLFYTVNFADDTEDKIVFILQQSDDEWRVDYFVRVAEVHW